MKGLPVLKLGDTVNCGDICSRYQALEIVQGIAHFFNLSVPLGAYKLEKGCYLFTHEVLVKEIKIDQLDVWCSIPVGVPIDTSPSVGPQIPQPGGIRFFRRIARLK